MKAVTSALPVKEPLMANMKTTNYLLNALLQMEAEDKGADMVSHLLPSMRAGHNRADHNRAGHNQGPATVQLPPSKK